MRAGGEPPSPERVPPPSRRDSASPSATGNTENATAIALHGHLIDPGASERSSVDPLAHLDPRQLASTSSGAVPLPRQARPGSNDDELAGIFDDDPEAAQVPSLLDPVHKPPDDPLAMLDRGQPQRPGGSGRAAFVPAPSVGAPITNQPLDQDREPAPVLPPRVPIPIIPDSWDPGLAVTGRAAPAPLPQPSASPIDVRLFTASHPLPEQGAARTADLRQPLFPTSSPGDAAGRRAPDAVTLLLQREAARGGVDGDPGQTIDTRLVPDRVQQNAVPRTTLFAAAPPAADRIALSAAEAADDETVDALWHALGIDPSRLPVADQRRLLAEIGQTIREVADGLIQILAARKHLRSEFRADQTTVGATQNNLFKFTRNADELLSLTMTNRNRVFLPMDAAAREAFNDIKAHEMATLAAVQLSIRAVLDRFQPAKLARQAEEQRRGRFAWLRPRSAAARCWEFFTNMYTELAVDADEASNRIFTVEFGRAYRERTEKRPVR